MNSKCLKFMSLFLVGILLSILTPSISNAATKVVPSTNLTAEIKIDKSVLTSGSLYLIVNGTKTKTYNIPVQPLMGTVTIQIPICIPNKNNIKITAVQIYPDSLLNNKTSTKNYTINYNSFFGNNFKGKTRMIINAKYDKVTLVNQARINFDGKLYFK